MTSPNGLLLIDKPVGWTSHDVVAKLRGILRERRIGHAGTLDPMATGLLVVAIGPATRLLRFAQAGTKVYEGELVLGAATDSLDADGVVVATAPVPALSAQRVGEAAAAMTGASMQRPPMVSAVKVGGRRLHELARAGEDVERSPRPIRVDRFTVAATADPIRWHFEVVCSPGTYVRVLGAELAESLGTLGHLGALRRIASGTFVVDEALSLEEIAARAAEDQLVVAPPSALVASLDSITLSPEQVVDVRHGRRVTIEASANEVAALDDDGHLVAVLARREDHYQPELVMPDAGPASGPR
jgi:tRNA pseudouridine55 synthase